MGWGIFAFLQRASILSILYLVHHPPIHQNPCFLDTSSPIRSTLLTITITFTLTPAILTPLPIERRILSLLQQVSYSRCVLLSGNRTRRVHS